MNNKTVNRKESVKILVKSVSVRYSVYIKWGVTLFLCTRYLIHRLL